MTKPVSGRRLRDLFAATILGAAFLAGGTFAANEPAFSQESQTVQGVTPWQAQREIQDFIDRFVDAQKSFGRSKLGSNDFSVRTKVEGLTRVYNEELGAIWVAQFSGAILPAVYNSDAEQGYAHGILKIYFDKTNGIQVVVNEGQGLWQMQQKTGILYEDLPEYPGSWKEWGGPGEEPEPVAETAAPASSPSQPNQLSPSGHSGDQSMTELGSRVKELGARLDELKRSGGDSSEIQAVYEAWLAAKREYMEAAQ
ncbi:hypothetical protein [Hoeflea olei]|uniref:Uncharacterized protein n=1 Tax=Hoeflea olei TaxID=1480615 RepID=A0A1C1YZ42_9HYPH|nr:hypothetical protein [Hoeflea olei]OCW58742.1 hypothetical protein AWJ14_00505 [Hoeflea olei]